MHVKGHIREAFAEVVESGLLWEEDLSLDTPVDLKEGYASRKAPLRRLLGLLWNSTDVMPADMRAEVSEVFDMEDEAVTYAQAAQRIYGQLSMVELIRH